MSQLLDSFSNYRDLEMHLILYGIDREIFHQIPQNIKVHLPKFQFKNKYRLIYSLKKMKFLRSTIKEISPYSILSFGEY